MVNDKMYERGVRKRSRLFIWFSYNTIFNPNTITDKSTFEKGLEFSAGIEYVMVNGTFILKNGKTVGNVFPGQPVYGKLKK